LPTTSLTAAPDGSPTAEEAAIARIAAALEAGGIAVCPGFASDAEVAELAAECRRAARAGELGPAYVGRGRARRILPDVRGDAIRWLPPAGATAAQRSLLARMERLRLEINRRTYLGLFDFECHFSLYPAGAVYRRHLDRFQDAADRVVSCVLYLNDGWAAADGGCLRVYAAAADAPLDVLPAGGTLVAFSSANHEHEVLPARRERLSIAGWFRRAR
jgi:SM-20-related protein